MPENYVTSRSEKGSVSISEDVIAVMVSAAISEIEGVAGFSTAIGADIAELLSRKGTNRGVRITTENGSTVLDVLVMVRYGYNVAEVAKKVQAEVAANMEAMTGMQVKVNVHVTGVAFEKTDMKG